MTDSIDFELGVPREAVVVTPALRLAGLEWGPAGATPVLALHGWLDNAASFAGLAPWLPHARVLALDLPGHGRSQHHPAGFPYAFVDMVAEVHEAVRELDLPPCVLRGHSLGAAVAAVLAGLLGNRLLGLVLLEGLGPLTDEPEQAPERLERALADGVKQRMRARRVFPSEADAVSRLCQARGRLEPAAARVLASRGLVATSGGWTWSYDPALTQTSRVRLVEPQVHAFLRRIEVPSLLVRAREGWPVPPMVMQARIACIGRLKLELVEGGHHVHLEAPARVAAVVRPFVDALFSV